ncbi:MAG: hypothetical protein IJN64_15100 [Lachnospiraceae bacterium]|nr:hypothetical protein [Lachnospiraceae bacterium]
MASFRESLSKGLTTINVKTNNFMEESKCKTYISTLEKEIRDLKLNLGDIMYGSWLSGESDETALQTIMEQIKQKYEEIEQQKKIMEQLTISEQQILGTGSNVQTGAMIYCAQCGAQNASNYKFCCKCGKALG